MRDEHTAGRQEHRDFFISYTHADRQWAEWIAWQLEEAQYSTILQAWDFRPGSNFVAEMDRAAQTTERTILVLSPSYFQSDYTFAEWAARFRRDPKGTHGLLLPIRIQPCNVEGLLGPIVYIDLVGCDEQAARERLLAGIPRGRVKPTSVSFPLSQHRDTQHPAFPAPLATIWIIPYPRNPVFTGRQEILTRLADALKAGQPAALSQPQAISGLGGIGKTQIAVEYAYQHRQDYQAVLWVPAQTREELISGYIAIAKALQLPEQNEQDQTKIIQAVMHWLAMETGWLLILDNADDLSLADEFQPSLFGGHILLTTRVHAMGRRANRVEVDTMPQDVGALFLLRRASLLAPDAPLEQASPADVTMAKELAEEMGGLPLALDQAGAYIEETQCGLSQYLQRYRRHRVLLLKRRGGTVPDHPEPVTTTWSLSFEKVEQASPVAAEVLRLCAFLHSEAIPEEIITQGAEHLGPVLAPLAGEPMALDEAIAALGAYSLLRRNASNNTLSIHRLVQAVLKDGMDEETSQQWAERTLQAINTSFSNADFTNYSYCDRLLPHALECVASIDQYQFVSLEAAELLHQAGDYAESRASHLQAEILHQHALALYEKIFGANDLRTVQIIDHLAEDYREQGRDAEAEPLYLRALALCENASEPDEHLTANILNDLALLYREQKRYTEAESLFQRSLTIKEKVLEPNDPSTARTLDNLAGCYVAQGQYAQAEPLRQRALAIFEDALGPDDPSTNIALHNLADLYHYQKKYEQAESLYLRTLAAKEENLPSDDPGIATTLANLATLYVDQGRYTEAEPLYQRALPIREKIWGQSHSKTDQIIESLARLYGIQNRYTEAESLYLRILSIRESMFGQSHLNTADILHNLAHLYHDQKRFTEAETYFRRTLTIFEEILGPEDSSTIHILECLAHLYYERKQYTEAETAFQQILTIKDKMFGPDSPSALFELNHLARLYRDQRRYAEAESFFQRVLSLREKELGPDDHDTGATLHDLALLYRDQKRNIEAETYFQRALAICENGSSPNNHDTAIVLQNYANLLLKMKRPVKAARLTVRAKALRIKPSS